MKHQDEIGKIEAEYQAEIGKIEAEYQAEIGKFEELFIGEKDVYSFQSIFNYKTFVFYQDTDPSLAKLSEFYGSDKGNLEKYNNPYPWASHNYTDFYSRLFKDRRSTVKKVFECGIGTNNESMASNMTRNGRPGASLRMWRDYFPNAIIYGADIDRDILFSEERIFTGYMDQTNSNSIFNFWRLVSVSDFDLMIDDGLHTFEAGSTLFSNSIEKLGDQGTYIIEDVNIDDLKKYYEFLKSYNLYVEYVVLTRKDIPINDNILICIRKKVI
jgi:hypothetical protein